MADRRLVEYQEERNEYGPYWTLTIERSAAGAPGGLVTIRNESFDKRIRDEEMTIVVKDLRILRPAVEWADSGV